MAGGAPHEISLLETIVSDFERETGERVRLIRQTTQTDQRRQSLLLALRGGSTDPDVFLLDVAWVAQFAASGWLLPLQERGVDPEAFLRRFLEPSTDGHGNLLCVPLYVDTGVLYARSDLLAKYGYPAPPRSWSELRAMAQRVQDGERSEGHGDFWGFVWQGAEYEGLVANALEYFSAAGGGFLDPAGRPALNRPANLRALRFMRDLIWRWRVSPPHTYTSMQEEDARRLFQSGRALFERNWPYAFRMHGAEGSAVRNRFYLLPLPRFSGGRQASCAGGWQVAVSVYADRKPQAVRFLRHLVSAKVQRRLALELGWNPGRADLYADAALRRELPHLAMLREVFDRAVFRPLIPEYTQVSRALQPLFNAVLAGEREPEEALEEAQERVERILGGRR